MSLKAAVNLFFERDAQRDTQRDTRPEHPPNSGTNSGTPPILGLSEGEGVSPEWLDGVAHLVTLPCPAEVSPERWRALQDDAVNFIQRWGVQAAKLGWETADLFGVNCVKPFRRVDAAGLIRLLDARKLVALTDGEAVIVCPTGSRQTYRRKTPGTVLAVDQCLLWELGQDA